MLTSHDIYPVLKNTDAVNYWLILPEKAQTMFLDMVVCPMKMPRALSCKFMFNILSKGILDSEILTNFIIFSRFRKKYEKTTQKCPILKVVFDKYSTVTSII